MSAGNFSLNFLFQSTPSAWRETRQDRIYYPDAVHFNPLPPHGGRRTDRGENAWLRDFNPLPPHGGRPSSYNQRRTVLLFQSTPSAWRETLMVWRNPSTRRHFNPLPPHGGRPVKYAKNQNREKFQSTPSAWRETLQIFHLPQHLTHFNPLPPHGGRHSFIDSANSRIVISIHSLRMEGDCGL